MAHAGRKPWVPYAFVAVPLVFYTLFIFAPLVVTIGLSLYEWDGLTPAVFVGFDNYESVLDSDIFTNALSNNFRFMVFYSVIPILLALLLAETIRVNRKSRMIPAYRFILFLPYVMPMVVIGIIWRWIYSPVSGPANAVLTATGRDPFPFLGDVDWALPAVGLVGSWVMYGFAMVLFIAGIEKIDLGLYDAASIDGANRLQTFRHVTLPGIRNELTVAIVVTIVTALKVFDLVFVMTRGGPARATDVVGFYIFRTAFNQREVGLAASAGTILVLITFAITLGILASRRIGAQ